MDVVTGRRLTRVAARRLRGRAVRLHGGRDRRRRRAGGLGRAPGRRAPRPAPRRRAWVSTVAWSQLRAGWQAEPAQRRRVRPARAVPGRQPGPGRSDRRGVPVPLGRARRHHPGRRPDPVQRPGLERRRHACSTASTRLPASSGCAATTRRPGISGSRERAAAHHRRLSRTGCASTRTATSGSRCGEPARSAATGPTATCVATVDRGGAAHLQRRVRRARARSPAHHHGTATTSPTDSWLELPGLRTAVPRRRRRLRPTGQPWIPPSSVPLERTPDMQLMRLGAAARNDPSSGSTSRPTSTCPTSCPTSTSRSSRAVGSSACARLVDDRAGDRATFGDERIGAPIARPHQILCIGLNYSDHAAETGQAVPTEPILFTKSPNTLVGPNDDVRIPRGSTKTDWEVELGIVIGRRTSYLETDDDARDAIAGFVARQRRQRARLPDGALRSVVEGEVGGDLQPGRPVAGDARRDRGRRRPGHVARGERRTADRPARPRR